MIVTVSHVDPEVEFRPIPRRGHTWVIANSPIPLGEGDAPLKRLYCREGEYAMAPLLPYLVKNDPSAIAAFFAALGAAFAVAADCDAGRLDVGYRLNPELLPTGQRRIFVSFAMGEIQ